MRANLQARTSKGEIAMTTTITLNGVDRPVVKIKDGRRLVAYKSLAHGATIEDLVSDKFVGPFYAIDDHCTRVRIGKVLRIMDLNKEAQEQFQKEYPKYNYIMDIGNIDESICRVVDSKGKVFCDKVGELEAAAIVNALNKQPKGIKDAINLGMGPGAGFHKHAYEDAFSFWCIRIHRSKKFTNEGYSVGYITPMWERYDLPSVMALSPMGALRFKSKSGANLVITEINKIIENLSITDDELTLHGMTHDPDDTRRIYYYGWDWSTMEPALVKFAYNVVK